MTEDDFLQQIRVLTDKTIGLTLGAQGFDLNDEIEVAEDWRWQREQVLTEMIETCTRLRGSRPVNGDVETIQ